MKAPDKVFFPNDINLLTKLSLILKQKGDVCYIRKDAILEWAKAQKARLKQGYKKEWKNDDILLGGELILDNLIEKIESL